MIVQELIYNHFTVRAAVQSSGEVLGTDEWIDGCPEEAGVHFATTNMITSETFCHLT